MTKEKKIDIKEFREKGYLQELNRNFLHPLGLALEVVICDDGREKLGGIWDCRENKKGIYYDILNSDLSRKERFRNNRNYINSEMENRIKERKEILGFGIEPLDSFYCDGVAITGSRCYRQCNTCKENF